MGEHFFESLDDNYSLIEQNPFLFQTKFKNIIYAPLTVVPYVVVYEVENKTIVVYAVFNTARHQEK